MHTCVHVLTDMIDSLGLECLGNGLAIGFLSKPTNKTGHVWIFQERKREREFVSLCVCVSVCLCVCMCLFVCVCLAEL